MLELKKRIQKLLLASVKQSNYTMAIRSNQLFKFYFRTLFLRIGFQTTDVLQFQFCAAVIFRSKSHLAASHAIDRIF